MIFKPKYTITDKILNNISQIAAGKEIIEHSRLIPKWELKLKKEARLHNAHSSTSIEGNRLTLEQVGMLSENKQIIGLVKDKQEVLNYLHALDAIPEYAGKKAIDVKLFLNIHKTITNGTLENSEDCGVFRNRQVFVGRRIFDGTQFREVVEYMPPRTRDVPRLVKEFLDWLNATKTSSIQPVILAGIAHYEVARIHPFIDGNGRTARLLASLVFYKTGFDHRRFFALDDYYDTDRYSYYAALKTVQKSKGDITKWLEYFTDGVLYSTNKVKEVIVKLDFLPKVNSAEQLELTSRQIEILERIKVKGKITNKELRANFNISRQAMLKEISKLIDTDIIELAGKGRGAYYRMH
ncbi:Fic family protein [bacterium]|nr:Fic family protein [bacterium]